VGGDRREQRRVLVCGGRDFSSGSIVGDILDEAHAYWPFRCVIHGGARGADVLAGVWAAMAGITTVVVPALWDFYGKPAGVRRNREMLRLLSPDLVIAFPGGPGTDNMKEQSQQWGFPVMEVKVS